MKRFAAAIVLVALAAVGRAAPRLTDIRQAPGPIMTATMIMVMTAMIGRSAYYGEARYSRPMAMPIMQVSPITVAITASPITRRRLTDLGRLTVRPGIRPTYSGCGAEAIDPIQKALQIAAFDLGDVGGGITLHVDIGDMRENRRSTQCASGPNSLISRLVKGRSFHSPARRWRCSPCPKASYRHWAIWTGPAYWHIRRIMPSLGFAIWSIRTLQPGKARYGIGDLQRIVGSKMQFDDQVQIHGLLP